MNFCRDRDFAGFGIGTEKFSRQDWVAAAFAGCSAVVIFGKIGLVLEIVKFLQPSQEAGFWPLDTFPPSSEIRRVRFTYENAAAMGRKGGLKGGPIGGLSRSPKKLAAIRKNATMAGKVPTDGFGRFIKCRPTTSNVAF
jgi:hypothetical protein